MPKTQKPKPKKARLWPTTETERTALRALFAAQAEIQRRIGVVWGERAARENVQAETNVELSRDLAEWIERK